MQVRLNSMNSITEELLRFLKDVDYAYLQLLNITVFEDWRNSIRVPCKVKESRGDAVKIVPSYSGGANPGLDLSLETGYLMRDFCDFFLVPPGKSWNSASTLATAASLHILPSSSFTNSYVVRYCLIWATDSDIK